MLKVRNSLWLISDTHFGHHNIIAFQQRPANHELIMLSEWIFRIRDDDQVLHLGDVFLGSKGNAARWSAVISRLPGKKYLIMGNHDKRKPSLYERAGFTIVPEFVSHGIAFTHRPVSEGFPGPAGDFHTNIHGHTHSNTFHPDHDGVPDPNITYINVCVEHTELAPVQLGSLFKGGIGKST